MEEFYKKVTYGFTAGAVFNNQAEYYYTDYDKASLTNLNIKATREFAISEKIAIPVSLIYIHNAGNNSTERFGRNFSEAGISFSYH